MIDIPALNAQLVAQDTALRDLLAAISARPGLDAGTTALLDMLGEGLAAIHERQGNLITLLLRTTN